MHKILYSRPGISYILLSWCAQFVPNFLFFRHLVTNLRTKSPQKSSNDSSNSSTPDLRGELLCDLRQIVATSLRLLQRHHQEIFKQLTLFQRPASGVGTVVLDLSLVRLTQYGLD